MLGTPSSMFLTGASAQSGSTGSSVASFAPLGASLDGVVLLTSAPRNALRSWHSNELSDELSHEHSLEPGTVQPAQHLIRQFRAKHSAKQLLQLEDETAK